MKSLTEFEQFKSRTKTILTALIPLSNIYKESHLVYLDEIPSNPTSGFHDLYLKCLIFNNLLLPLNIKYFVKQTTNVRLLIELFFSPGLELSLLDFHQELTCLDNCVKLLKEYKEDVLFSNIQTGCYAARWDDDMLRNTPDTFINLIESIGSYIAWYDVNKSALYASEKSVITPIDEERKNQMLNDFFDNPELNIDQDHDELCFLEHGDILGTTGLATCVAIVGVFKEKSKYAQILLSHASFPLECMQSIEVEYAKKHPNRAYYLIGGEPINLDAFLPIIYENTIPIKDVRLCAISTAGSDCMVYFDEKNNGLNICYTGDLCHAKAPKIVPEKSAEKVSISDKSRLTENKNTFYHAAEEQNKKRKRATNENPQENRNSLHDHGDQQKRPKTGDLDSQEPNNQQIVSGHSKP